MIRHLQVRVGKEQEPSREEGGAQRTAEHIYRQNLGWKTFPIAVAIFWKILF